MEYDVFICHASEDKQEFVEPLANALREAGLNVWYDRFELKLGDSLRRKIDQGLSNSRYGVVVLSKAFFNKEWPQDELDALVGKENEERRKVILPIWHNIDAKEVTQFSPILASKLAVRSDVGMDNIVTQIIEACEEEVTSSNVSVFQTSGGLNLRERCLEIIRQEDTLAWRKLIKETCQPIPNQLKGWKKEGEAAAHKGGKDWEQAIINAAVICLPGFVPIFSAIEAGKKDFWKESIGILRRLAILEDEMGGGATWALHIGNHMLYVAGTIGLAIAANLKLLGLIDEWMQIKIAQRHEGELPWLQIRSAHYLPEGIGFDVKEPFDILKTVCNSKELKNFFPNPKVFVDNILIANLLCSLIELRVCSQNQKCLDALIGKSDYFSPDVCTVWCILPADKFRIEALNLFGDSQGVISFVYPSGFMTVDKFWPLWKRWKERCLNLWWQSSSGRYDFLIKKPWMLLPGEQAN